jgi:hypothetical protein
MKNKISNLSYFLKRLKDSNFVAWKMFNNYSEADTRLWTVLVNPGQESVYITCRKYIDSNKEKEWEFELHHDNLRLQNNLKIRTLSMEVIISHILRAGARNDSELYRTPTK